MQSFLDEVKAEFPRCNITIALGENGHDMARCNDCRGVSYSLSPQVFYKSRTALLKHLGSEDHKSNQAARLQLQGEDAGRLQQRPILPPPRQVREQSKAIASGNSYTEPRQKQSTNTLVSTESASIKAAEKSRLEDQSRLEEESVLEKIRLEEESHLEEDAQVKDTRIKDLEEHVRILEKENAKLQEKCDLMGVNYICDLCEGVIDELK